MLNTLTQRARLLARTLTPDGGGGFSESWTAFATVWIALAPVSATDEPNADHLESRVRHRARCAARADLAAGQRVAVDQRTFRVHAVLDDGPRAAYVTLQCEELPQGGFNMSASWALQQAIFATLANDNGVKDAVGDPPRVYDSVPARHGVPLHRHRRRQGDRLDHQDRRRLRARAHHPHLVARRRPPAKRASPPEAVLDALDAAELSIDGQVLIDIRWLDTNVTRESDGETLHAQLRFRAVLEPT